MVGVDVKGVLVCDKSGLVLTSKTKNHLRMIENSFFFSVYLGKDVSYPSGPISRLAELAGSLSGRRTTVCLENQEKSVDRSSSNSCQSLFFFFFSSQILIHQTDKAVVAVYTKNAT